MENTVYNGFKLPYRFGDDTPDLSHLTPLERQELFDLVMPKRTEFPDGSVIIYGTAGATGFTETDLRKYFTPSS